MSNSNSSKKASQDDKTKGLTAEAEELLDELAAEEALDDVAEDFGVDASEAPPEAVKGIRVFRRPGKVVPGKPNGRVSRRLKGLRILVRAQVARKYPGLDEEAAEAVVEETLSTVHESHPDFDHWWNQLAPISTSEYRKAKGFSRAAEIAAVRRLPAVQWLTNELLARVGKRGPAPDHGFALWILLRMSWKTGRAAISHALDEARELNITHDWLRDFARHACDTQVYKGIADMLLHRSPRMAIHANIALLKQLIKTLEGDVPEKQRRICVYATADATDIHADVEQRPERSLEDREFVRGARKRAQWMVYKTATQKILKSWFGYKLVLIADQSTTLPIIWKLVPARSHEPAVVLDLLKELRTIWPECPIEFLTTDALYDTEKFTRGLLFGHSVQPVIPLVRALAGSHLHGETKGHPTCCHKKDGSFEHMERQQRNGFKTWRDRLAAGKAPGEAFGVDAFIRWVCPNGVCKPVTTRPAKNPRLYTYLCHEGPNETVGMRHALLCRRNSIESIFWSLKHLGLAGDKYQRVSWADDREMDWLISLGLLFITARRVAWHVGAYDDAMAEAKAMGFVRKSDVAPQLDEVSIQRMLKERAERGWIAEAPTSWAEELARGYEEPDYFEGWDHGGEVAESA